MTIRSKLAIAAVAASVSAIAAPAFAAGTTFDLYGEVVSAPQVVTSQVSRAEVRAEAQKVSAKVDNVWLPDAQQYAGASDKTRAEVRAEGRSLTADDYSRRQAAVYSAARS